MTFAEWRKEHPQLFLALVIIGCAIFIGALVFLIVILAKKNKKENYTAEHFGSMLVANENEYIQSAIDSVMGNGAGVALDV